MPDHPPGDPGLLHGIGWTPDQAEVWQSDSWERPACLRLGHARADAAGVEGQADVEKRHGSHWLTFDIKGNYGYVAPNKNSADGTEIFNARTHASVGVIGSSEDMLEIDFADGKITQTGDQYGIGRRQQMAKSR